MEYVYIIARKVVYIKKRAPLESHKRGVPAGRLPSTGSESVENYFGPKAGVVCATPARSSLNYRQALSTSRKSEVVRKTDTHRLWVSVRSGFNDRGAR